MCARWLPDSNCAVRRARQRMQAASCAGCSARARSCAATRDCRARESTGDEHKHAKASESGLVLLRSAASTRRAPSTHVAVLFAAGRSVVRSCPCCLSSDLCISADGEFLLVQLYLLRQLRCGVTDELKHRCGGGCSERNDRSWLLDGATRRLEQARTDGAAARRSETSAL